MINTFHSSFNPPPVPPRQGHRGPVLPSNTPLVKFLSVMLLLLMLLTFGGFFYMFHRLSVMQFRYSEAHFLKQLLQCVGNKLRPEDVQDCRRLAENYRAGQDGTMAFLSGQDYSTIPQAHLLPERPKQSDQNQLGTMYWDENHSVVKKLQLNSNGSITIDDPGYYFVYSQVTFTKRHSKVPLRQAIWSRKPETGRKGFSTWEKLLASYCSLAQSSLVPEVCTASQSGIFRLEGNQQLFLNVTERDLVDFEYSTFGLFKLQD